MNEDNKTLEKPVKSIKDLPIKQAAVLLLSENDVKKADIAKELNYKESSVNTIASNLKRFGFTGNLTAQKKAFKTISSLSEGKIPKDSVIDEVKDSTALKASMYVSDHNDPVVQHVQTDNLHVIAIITPETLQKYK